MTEQAPYRCHIFVCVNDRRGARKSCADGRSHEIRQLLKDRIAELQLPPGSIRVSQSLCMGLCERGPNLMIYPQGIWHFGVKIEDIDAIVAEVLGLLAESPGN